MRYLLFAAALLTTGSSSFAQSEADVILRITRDMPVTSAMVYRTVSLHSEPPSSTPPFHNVFTYFSDYSANSGVPCFDCVSGASVQTIGGPIPNSNVHADGVTMYAFNNYFIDNSFTGSCTETFLVQDQASKYIVKIVYTFEDQQPGMSGFYYAPTTLPNESAAAGNGKAVTIIQCGTTTSLSSTPLYINYP